MSWMWQFLSKRVWGSYPSWRFKLLSKLTISIDSDSRGSASHRLHLIPHSFNCLSASWLTLNPSCPLTGQLPTLEETAQRAGHEVQPYKGLERECQFTSIHCSKKPQKSQLQSAVILPLQCHRTSSLQSTYINPHSNICGYHVVNCLNSQYPVSHYSALLPPCPRTIIPFILPSAVLSDNVFFFFPCTAATVAQLPRLLH